MILWSIPAVLALVCAALWAGVWYVHREFPVMPLDEFERRWARFRPTNYFQRFDKPFASVPAITATSGGWAIPAATASWPLSHKEQMILELLRGR